MSRARKIIEMLEDGEPVSIPTYTVNPAGDPPHIHTLQIDPEGYGKLSNQSEGEPHDHEVTNWAVQSAGSFPHIHEIVRQEVVHPNTLANDMVNHEPNSPAKDMFDKSPIGQALANIVPGLHKCSCEEYTEAAVDREWDDHISDTKEPVKISMSRETPTVRRVFDKKGKYIGSFDTKNSKDKVKYKSMFKGAK